MYINCHTYYSLRYGVLSERELVDRALLDHVDRVVLTDINNTSGCLNFVRFAQQADIKPILGIDFRDGAKQLYVGIAKNNEGFQQLNDFLSHYRHQDKPFPDQAPPLSEVYFIYPLDHLEAIGKETFYPGEYIGINRKDLNILHRSRYKKYKTIHVVLNSYSFQTKKDFNTHRLLRAIDNNTLLSKLDISQQGKEDDIYLTQQQVREIYRDHRYMLTNTKALLEACSIYFDFSKDRPHQNKTSYTGSTLKDEILLHDLCDKGLQYRYGDDLTAEIKARMRKELDIIKQMDFVPFFLVNWDIINYAKDKGYFHIGRGSGANSLVAYLLGITDVDPIELDLYFERFMNLYRTSPPDFDIDFSWQDREDVTRYIFERFGEDNQVALIATYNTFKHRAAVRELGKVFGLPKHEIDVLSRGSFEFQKLDKLSKLVIIYAQELEGKPNYLSIHAGGIIISERNIHFYSATDLPPKGFPTVQFDMVIAEDVGLYKYDILAQRGLGKIKDALQLVKINHPQAPDIDIHRVKAFFQDPNVNELISGARCVGCFYVESPAMRMLLSKLSVDTYQGLVAASSIIRPGVSQSGMMKEYILRHKNPERRKKAHPILYNIMPDTYGVMVYQEDVIKVAHHFAKLTLGEADVLRRGMSGKYRSRDEFLQVKDKFIANCRAEGYTDKVITEVWRQIESFAGYAFAKGHSASYAVESYQSLYLKTYYPLEYMVAVINNGGGFYSTELYVQEARKMGGNIHAPCINQSHYPTWLYGKDIYLGFHLLHALEHEVALSIIAERKENGAFTSLENFLERVYIGMEQLDILIRIDAFRSTGIDKRTLLWKAHYLQKGVEKPAIQTSLFERKLSCEQYDLPTFEIDQLEHAFDQIELLGFPLCHPFLLLREDLNAYQLLAADLPKYNNKKVSIYGYLITVKSTKTSNGKHMQFGTFQDVKGDWIDTVHFPPVVARFPFRGKGIYRIEGIVKEEFGYYTIEASSIERMAYREDVRYSVNG